MVIVGGAGNNCGAVFGALLIYLAWIISDPVAQAVFRADHRTWSTQTRLGRHSRNRVAGEPDARVRARCGDHARAAVRAARADPRMVEATDLVDDALEERPRDALEVALDAGLEVLKLGRARTLAATAPG